MTDSEDFGLTLGSKVSLSRLGAERCSRCIGHTGKVVGFHVPTAVFAFSSRARKLRAVFIEPILNQSMLKPLNPPKSESTIPSSSKNGPICILFWQ
jgi:hypothetical protein